MELKNNPMDGSESTALTDSNATREEEERHQRLLQETDQLKQQIAEVFKHLKIWCSEF